MASLESGQHKITTSTQRLDEKTPKWAERLIATVNLLVEDVSGLKQDVSGLKQDVSGLKQDVSGLKQDVSGLKQEAEEQRKVIDANALDFQRQMLRLETAIGARHVIGDLDRKPRERLLDSHIKKGYTCLETLEMAEPGWLRHV